MDNDKLSNLEGSQSMHIKKSNSQNNQNEPGDVHRSSSPSNIKRDERNSPLSRRMSIPSSDLLTPIKKHGKSTYQFVDNSSKEKIEALPLLKNASKDELDGLLISKIRQCRVIYDFMQPSSDVNEKEVKKNALNEISEFLSNPDVGLKENLYKELIEMVAINLFRPLPPCTKLIELECDPEEDDTTLEASWPHMELVYGIFLTLFQSPKFDPKIAKDIITKSFIAQTVELFGSEDQRERNLLKVVLHTIYGKILPLRAFIRKTIKNAFFTFIYETERYYGMAELLEFLSSIINGFTLPLKPEHVDFLIKALMPLHTSRMLNLYHMQLSFCITQFVEKDASLAISIIKRLYRYWPVTNSSKELLFLNEIEDILSIIENEQFVEIYPIFFYKYNECISSPHFQVAERSLAIWNNERILSLVIDNIEVVLPCIFEKSLDNSLHHWNESIRNMSWHSLKILKDMDYEIFNENIKSYLEKHPECSEDELNIKLFEDEEYEGIGYEYENLYEHTNSEGEIENGPN